MPPTYAADICGSWRPPDGLQTPIYVNQAVSQSTGSRYLEKGAVTYQIKDVVKDVEAFRQIFLSHLQVVTTFLWQVDEDLPTVAKTIQKLFLGFVHSVQMVNLKLSVLACITLEKLPRLLKAAGGQIGTEISSITEIRNSMAAMRKDTRAIRTDYLDLLGQIRYLGSCVKVTRDEMVISSMSEPVEHEHGSLECISPKTDLQKLELTLAHLDSMRQIVKRRPDFTDFTDFWCRLQHAELHLQKLEKEAKMLCIPSAEEQMEQKHGGKTSVTSFCKHVRSFCGSYCGVRPWGSHF